MTNINGLQHNRRLSDETGDTDVIFDIRDLCFTWDTHWQARRRRACYLIRGFSAQLCRGQFVACIGRNGSGKSTFLKILAGLNRRYEGDIFFYSQPLSRLKPGILARRMSYMSQTTDDMLPFTVREITDMGNYAGLDGLDDKHADDRTERALELTGLTDKADIPFKQLSGGYRQRVMLARAICQSLNVILLDEPVSGLDIVCKDNMMQMLRHIADTHNSLIVMSLHDIEQAKQYADRILCFGSQTPLMISPAELTDDKIRQIFAEEQ